MQTAYEKIKDYSGTTEDFRTFLRKYGYDRIFSPLYEMYDSARLIRQVIEYIVNAYSVNSEFVTMGSSWKGVKEAVARHVQLPDEVQDLIVYLGNYETYEVTRKKSPKNRDEFEEQENKEELNPDAIYEESSDDELPINKIISVITAWLDFQNDRDHKHLMMLNDQYEEMMIASQQKLTKSGGGIDFATKAQCRKHAAEIKGEIELLEKKIRDKDPMMIRDARKEIKTIRPETTIPV